MFDLTGKVALITGAAGSLGSAVAEVYAKHGADLFLVDLDRNQLTALSKQIAVEGQRIHIREGDIGNSSDTDAIFDELDKEFGRIDILVNVAGPAKRAAAATRLKGSASRWNRAANPTVLHDQGPSMAAITAVRTVNESARPPKNVR